MQKTYESARAVRDSIPVGESVTLVGGSFDLLHVGHLHVLEYSKKLGGLLVVCVLSNAYVKSYKGPNRPIIGESHRAVMVAALRCVDRVYISDIGTSHRDTLSVIRPDRAVYGNGDSESEKAKVSKRAKFLRTHFPNIEIHFLERFPDREISTGGIIQRILNLSNPSSIQMNVSKTPKH
jgi:cytidyltransferase-like protein